LNNAFRRDLMQASGLVLTANALKSEQHFFGKPHTRRKENAMRTRRFFKSIGVALCLMGLGALMTACGGGGGGSSSGSPSAPSGTGSVAVLITDGPSAEMDELSLEISRISLIPAGEGEAVVIYDDPQPDTINVLDYKSKEEPYFLTLKDEVPAGYYAKIRLEIDNITVKGLPCEGKDIKLPSGKIDLNPRGGFYVKEGESIAIQLDFDANKSFNLHQAGNSGKCILRPVIFVDIHTIDLQPRCPKIIKGTIEDIDSSEDGNTKFLLKPAGNRGTIWVIVDEGTVIVDEKGVVTQDETILQPGDTVYVRGRLTREGILASLVVEGEVLKVDGKSNDSVKSDSLGLFFPFIPNSGEAVIDDINVRVSEKTPILLDCNTAGSLDDISKDTPVTVIGKLSADGLIAAAILIEAAEVKGELTAINDPTSSLASYEFVIKKDDGNEEKIVVPADTPIHLVGDGPLQIADLQRLVNDTACNFNPRVRVLVDAATPGAKTALKVLVYPEELTGTVVSVDPTNGIIVLKVEGVDKIIKVDGTAKIFESGEECNDLQFNELKSGHNVTVFGIPTCTVDPTDADFIAYTVVVNG